MTDNNKNSRGQGGSAESQSQNGGTNEARGNSKPSEPGMTPGVSQGAAKAQTANDAKAQVVDATKDADETKKQDQENADLEQQYKETLTERD